MNLTQRMENIESMDNQKLYNIKKQPHYFTPVVTSKRTYFSGEIRFSYHSTSFTSRRWRNTRVSDRHFRRDGYTLCCFQRYRCSFESLLRIFSFLYFLNNNSFFFDRTPRAFIVLDDIAVATLTEMLWI